MRDLLFVLQIVIGIILSGMILIQVKGTGFGRVWGGLSTSSSRRGLEGIIFKMTFAFGIIFILVSTTSLFF